MKFEGNYSNKSLADLDGSYRNVSIDFSTNLTKKCITLLTVPISSYTIEDIRIMIGQGFGLSYLIPLAIEFLKTDLLSEGDLYPGDLLSNVLNISTKFWKEQPTYWMQINQLVANRKGELENEGISFKKFNSIKNNESL